MVGIVVSKPTARNTTGRRWLPRNADQLTSGSRPAAPCPVPVREESDLPEAPGTFIMSPKVAMHGLLFLDERKGVVDVTRRRHAHGAAGP